MNNGFLAGFISFSENLIKDNLDLFLRCPICGNVMDIPNALCPCDWAIAEYGIWFAD